MNDYEIVPLSSSMELYQEGYQMKNCVGSYVDRVMDVDCYIYSIRHGEKPVATLEVVKGGTIGQLRGPCNQAAPREIETAARQWLRNHTGRGLSEAA